MTQDKFLELISTYGGSPQRWPEAVREEAIVFLEHNKADLEQELDEAVSIDQLLDEMTVYPPSDLLRQRILNALPPQTEKRASRNNGFGYKSVAAMVLIAFALGFGGAQFMPSAIETDRLMVSTPMDDTSETVWLEAANELGLSEIYTWVEGETDTLSDMSGI